MNERLVTTAILLTLGAAAHADAGTFTKQRAYRSCVDRIESVTGDAAPVFERDHFIAQTDDGLRVYVNATVWDDGERRPVRAECATDARGRSVVTLGIEPGWFAEQTFEEAVADQ